MRPTTWKPYLSRVSSFESLLAANIVTRSKGILSTKSTSPDCSAFTAVCASGILIHSTRSTFTTLPPDVQLGGSLRGM